MVLHALRVVFILLEVLVLFNLLIVVHEVGHFLAARWRGLYIEKFGIWFGKPIWKKTVNGVQYSLGSLPFGGFVALPQLAPMDMIEGKADVDRENLPPVKALDKIIVALAGPVFSFLLAVFFAVIIWAVGRPMGESETTTMIGYVVADSPAAEAGLKAGDKILSVDGSAVTRFGGMGDDSISWRIIRSEGETIAIEIERNGEKKTVEAKPRIPKTKPWMRKGLREIGILPKETPMVAKVVPGGPAEKAGLKPNDLLVSINGQPIYDVLGISEFIRDNPNEPLTLGVERGGSKIAVPFEPGNPVVDYVVKDGPAARGGLQKGDMILSIDGQPAKSTIAVSEYIKQHANQPIAMSILRDGKQQEVKITPEIPQDETIARIGLQWADDFGIVLDQYGRMTVKYPRPTEQVRSAMLSIVRTVEAIASPKSDVKLQHMSGPVMMMRIYYMMFENKEGWRLALWFSVVINVNLALINLIPLPVLDGGHIVLGLLEGIRRKPLNTKVWEVIQTACAILLIGFMAYIAFFDVQDLFGSRREGPRFVPKPTPAKVDR